MGQPIDWRMKYNWRVLADGLSYGYFSTMGAIKGTIARVEHYEGGQRYPHVLPGTMKWDSVELTRGASGDNDLWNMFLDTYDAAKRAGGDPPALFRSIDVEELGAGPTADDRTVLTRYVLHNAWVSSWSPGDRDAKADEVAIETVTLEFAYAERLPA